MGLDTLFRQVRKALEQASLLSEIELSRDYRNNCLIVRSIDPNACGGALEECSGSVYDNRHSNEQKGDNSEASTCSDWKIFWQEENKNGEFAKSDHRNLQSDGQFMRCPSPNGRSVFPDVEIPLDLVTGKQTLGLENSMNPFQKCAPLHLPMGESTLTMHGKLVNVNEEIPNRAFVTPEFERTMNSGPTESEPFPQREDQDSASHAASLESQPTFSPAIIKKSKTTRKSLKFMKDKGANPVACVYCDYDGRLEFNRHMRKHGPPFICPICQHPSKGVATFCAHMRSHTGEMPFKCDVCGKALRTNATLKRHKIRHMIDKNFSCKYCDFTCKCSTSLAQHVKCMHPDTCCLYKCSLCRFSTVNEKRRLNHIKAHEQNICFPCDVCGKLFYDKRDLQFHVRNHKKTEPRKKNITCPECGEKFLNNQRLSSHRFKHTGQNEFKCRFCGLEHRKLCSVLKHFTKFHPSEKIFRCDLCNFDTNNLREKNKHYTSVMHLDKQSKAIQI